MVFCNKEDKILKKYDVLGHNPYFNRWFSAMLSTKDFLNGKESHNPYFNRWFSAMY